ncbi:IS66 family insertion sequence element accessory protein TnpA [Methylohalobius crimeensis]|uniref:IS66 family insertion sequence element accessory protein TnpA n=1 Tax=Methylohalobius crimeensis TaxID=244365 RepID=UPI00389950AF
MAGERPVAAEYCKQHGLKFSHFAYWRTRNNKQRRKLVPLWVPPASAPDRLVLDLPYGIRLELPAQALGEVLPTVLRSLREAS